MNVNSTHVQEGHHGGEPLLAKIATVAVVIHCRHVLVGMGLGHKQLVARFAGDTSDRTHTDGIHVRIHVGIGV